MTSEYTRPEFARLAGINMKTLHHWCKTGFFAPTLKLPEGRGSYCVYSEDDLFLARVIVTLRTAGVSVEALRGPVKELRETSEWRGLDVLSIAGERVTFVVDLAGIRNGVVRRIKVAPQEVT